MASYDIRWNPNALYDIRRSPGVVAAVEGLADKIAEAANANGVGTYATGSQQGEKRPQGRWRATVVTADFAAILDNYRHNTLLNSLNG